MEPILDLMYDESLMGIIDQGIKSTVCGNSFPVSNPKILNYFNESQIKIDRKNTFDGWDLYKIDEVKKRPAYIEDPPSISIAPMRDPFLDEYASALTTQKLPEFWDDLLNTKEVPDSWENLPESNDETSKETVEDKIHDEVCSLLANCLHRNKRTRPQLERAVELIEDYKLTNFTHFVHGLVHFPDLLERFLTVQKNKGAIIEDNDLACMFARCIEHHSGDTFAHESIKHLLDFKGDREIEMKLLPGKYPIDSELYDMIRKEKVRDSYYDATQQCQYFVYAHKDIVTQEKERYTGFRDSYHSLLYGETEHLQALIVRWDLWGDDCTADAAREFFGLSPECPIEAVKANVNKKCHS